VQIEVERTLIRVTVSDSAPEPPLLITPSSDGGYGLTIVDALASRWETTRHGHQNLTWFELDLRHPGD
jgi:hypothetical protein